MKKAVFFLAIIIGVFGFWQKSQALTSNYFDNFDSYATGTLAGKGSWQSIASSTWQITNLQNNSSPNSLQSGAPSGLYPYISLGTTTQLTLSFDLFITTSSLNYFSITTKNPSSSYDLTMLYVECVPGWYGDDCALGLVYGSEANKSLRIPVQQWVTITWAVDYSTGLQGLSYTHNGTTDFISAPTDNPEGEPFATGAWLNNYNSTNFFIDNFLYFQPQAINTIGPSLSGVMINPDFPVECFYNTNAWTGKAIGTIINPASSTITWYQIEMIANDYFSGTKISATSSINVAPGQTKPYSISYNLADTTLWEIAYIIYGVDQSTGQYTFETLTGKTYCPGDLTTWIGEPASSTLELLQCDLDQLQDNCTTSTYSTLEKFTCRVVGALERGVIPTCSGWAKLQRYQNALKNRAPYNYVQKIVTFFEDIIVPTTTATNVQPILDSTDNISQLSFFTILRNILSGVLMILFGVAIYKKVLRKMFK